MLQIRTHQDDPTCVVIEYVAKNGKVETFAMIGREPEWEACGTGWSVWQGEAIDEADPVENGFKTKPEAIGGAMVIALALVKIYEGDADILSEA